MTAPPGVRTRITAVDASAYTIPTDAPEADGTLTWDSTTMVVATVRCGGVTGVGWTYGPAACARVITDTLADVVTGQNPLHVPRIWQDMVNAVRNQTRPGVAGYAISAVDVACWDLKARLVGLSLPDLLGAVRPDVPVYGSGGFTTYTDEQMTRQLGGWAHDKHIGRVKIKIGEGWGTRTDRDRDRIGRAREVIGPDCALFVDANGAYTPKQAVRLLRDCAPYRVTWFEEPVSSDDLDGLRFVREHVDADVTAGEYGSDVYYFRRMCAAGAVDCLQIDATRCGGYTAWLRAAAVAAAHQIDVSAHCAPNLHAPVAAATPNLRHLEWFHDHVRIEERAFDGALDPAGGSVSPDPARPGHGLALQQDFLDPYRTA